MVVKRQFQDVCRRRLYGSDRSGKKAEFCFKHADEGMASRASKRCRCSTEGCTRRSSHGVDETKTTELCSEHAKGGKRPPQPSDVRSVAATAAVKKKPPL